MTSTPPADERFDALLGNLASAHTSIGGFLSTVFSFLHRRTDFYVVDPNPKRPIGFDHGQAEQLVLSAFRKFPLKEPSGRSVPHPSQGPLGTFGTAATSSGSPGKRGQPEASSSSPSSSKSDVPSPAKTAVPSLPSVKDTARERSGQESKKAAPVKAVAIASENAVASTAAPSSSSTAALTFPIKRNERGEQIPFNNGGAGPRNRYWWSQTVKEANLFVPLVGLPSSAAEALKTKKGIKIKIAAGKHLSLSFGDTVWLEGSLFSPVKTDHESFGDSGVLWTLDRDPSSVQRIPRPVSLEEGKEGNGSESDEKGPCLGLLTIPFEKADELWWKRCFSSHAVPAPPAASTTAEGFADWPGFAIDATLVDSTRSVDEYDESTQQAIRRVMWEQAKGTDPAVIASAINSSSSISSSLP